MTEGKRNVSGDLVLDDEEKKELITPCVVEWTNEKGADSIGTNINCDYIDSTSSLDNRDENLSSRSNMIVSGDRTTSKFNVFIATCAGT